MTDHGTCDECGLPLTLCNVRTFLRLARKARTDDQRLESIREAEGYLADYIAKAHPHTREA